MRGEAKHGLLVSNVITGKYLPKDARANFVLVFLPESYNSHINGKK